MSLVELPLATPSLAATPTAASEEVGFAAQLRRAFGMDAIAAAYDAPLVTAPLTLARLTTGGDKQRTVSLVTENATLASIELAPSPQASLRTPAAHPVPVNSGALNLFALEAGADFIVSGRPDCLLLYLPNVALRELAARHGAPLVDRLAPQNGASDSVVRHLAFAIASSFGDESKPTTAHLRHAAFALGARLTQRFGRVDPASGAGPAALTSEQLRLAQARLTEGLLRGPDLAAIARACGVSPALFSAGFRRIAGQSPLGWLREKRLERAQALLLHSGLSLGQITYECGFADQAHFTRAFAAAFGVPPGAWRRAHLKKNCCVSFVQNENTRIQYPM